MTGRENVFATILVVVGCVVMLAAFGVGVHELAHRIAEALATLGGSR